MYGCVCVWVRKCLWRWKKFWFILSFSTSVLVCGETKNFLREKLITDTICLHEITFRKLRDFADRLARHATINAKLDARWRKEEEVVGRSNSNGSSNDEDEL